MKYLLATLVTIGLMGGVATTMANDWSKSFNTSSSTATSGTILVHPRSQQNYVIACEEKGTGVQYMPRSVTLYCTSADNLLIVNDDKHPMQVARKSSKGYFQVFGFYVKNKSSNQSFHIEIKPDCSNKPGSTQIPNFYVQEEGSNNTPTCGDKYRVDIKEYTKDDTYDLIPCVEVSNCPR